VVHNDTKINNILFDSRSQQAVAVIDLDTLMPGYFIYDLGDMVRTFVSPVSEEEPDLSKVSFRFPFYKSLLEGYLSEMDDCLSEEEKKAIPYSGMMMTYIMAIRFLADYLNGDIYYHIDYSGQNLVRASNQLRLLALIKQNVQPDVDDPAND
jgi:Ser/Thr protein kinase RdoA (MazF antagonist)